MMEIRLLRVLEIEKRPHTDGSISCIIRGRNQQDEVVLISMPRSSAETLLGLLQHSLSA